MKIKEHWLGPTNLPITMYRLINEGLDIYNIGTVIGQRHDEYNINPFTHRVHLSTKFGG